MPKPNEPCVSTLVVNYRTAELTRAAVESALAEPCVGEVIVLDNAPDTPGRDLLGTLAARHRGRLKLIVSSTNLGFGGGTNRAAARATLPYLFLLNSDATLQPGALEPVVSELDDRSIGIAAPPVYRPDGRTLQPDVCGAFPTPRRILTRSTRAPCADVAPDWLSGVAMLLRREEFALLGGFDERIFLYYEDVELCWRYRRHLRLEMRRRSSGPGVVHLGGASRRGRQAQKRAYAASQDYFLKKAGFDATSRLMVRAARFAAARVGRSLDRG